MSVRAFYADWAGYNRRWIEGLKRLTPEDLALPVHADRGYETNPWPIWAVAGHTAGTRVYWFCDVFGEPGAELTPFEGATMGWEDDLSHPRSAEELVQAWESTWAVIEGCLDRWTPAMLGESIRREEGDRPVEFHTRQSVLMRAINHEAYHLGEINLVLGGNGREPIESWPGREWREGAPAELREGKPRGTSA
jgi:uncharacterized damage-inducible protein DinB